ncbi:MAG: hypothetical protein QOH69_2955 [Actinomycetota bacterium]|nr:hypothetical protein [Actinomycetota bacterium]
MTQQDLSARTQDFTARTQSFSSQNRVVEAVAGIRTLQGDLTPDQLRVRELGRQRTAEALATGAYSLAPRL